MFASGRVGKQKFEPDFLIIIICHQITQNQASADLEFSFHQIGVCSAKSVDDIKKRTSTVKLS